MTRDPHTVRCPTCKAWPFVRCFERDLWDEDKIRRVPPHAERIAAAEQWPIEKKRGR